MSTPLNIDVCPISFLNYLTSPMVYTVAYKYEADVVPYCVNGKAPYRLYAEVYAVNNPYTGQVNIYVDDELYGTYNIVNGIVDLVLLIDPGIHSIAVATPDGNALKILSVSARCM